MAYATVITDPDRILVVAACIHRSFLERPNVYSEHVSTVTRYLLGKRPFTSELGGLWEMPGGKVHGAETIYRALVREIGEELRWGDIVPDIPEVMCKADVDYPHGKFRVIFINIEIGAETDDMPMLIQHLGLVWWTLPDLQEMELNGHLTLAMKTVIAFLSST